MLVNFSLYLLIACSIGRVNNWEDVTKVFVAFVGEVHETLQTQSNLGELYTFVRELHSYDDKSFEYFTSLYFNYKVNYTIPWS